MCDSFSSWLFHCMLVQVDCKYKHVLLFLNTSKYTVYVFLIINFDTVYVSLSRVALGLISIPSSEYRHVLHLSCSVLCIFVWSSPPPSVYCLCLHTLNSAYLGFGYWFSLVRIYLPSLAANT